MTICVNGVGTSIMAKKLVSNSITELGYNIKDIEIDEASLSKVESVSCNLIITTSGLSERIPASVKSHIDVISVVNMISGKEKMKEALELLKSIPKRVENVSSNPSDIVAVFTEYSDSALVIMYIYFIEKQGDILGVTSNMNMEILAAFNKAGLNLAFPTRTVYIQKDESLKQES